MWSFTVSAFNKSGAFSLRDNNIGGHAKTLGLTVRLKRPYVARDSLVGIVLVDIDLSQFVVSLIDLKNVLQLRLEIVLFRIRNLIINVVLKKSRQTSCK